MQSKNTKRSLLTSGFSLLICCALLVGTTFAWFTDSVTSQGNKIQAGTLDVQLWNGEQDISNSAVPVFDYNLWEPGYSTGANLSVHNVGSLAVKYELELQNVTTTKGMEKVIDVMVNNDVQGTLADFMQGENLDAGVLEAHTNSPAVSVVLKMQESAGNAYQGGTASFDILLKATQATVEQDGFGNNQYDAGADVELLSGVSIGGIAGLEGQVFDTVQQAYAAGNEILAAYGLGQEPLSDEAFDAIYTDDGVITWTVYGAQTLENNERILTFGRASNRYSSTRSIREINVVGGNESARLYMQNVGLPYAWWNDAEDALAVNFKQLQLTATGDGQITCSRAYGTPLTVTFDQCDITGRIYHYFNGEGTISITNCNFTDAGTNGYAFFVQGSETEPLTVNFSGNTVTGYTRGINIQQKTANVTIKDNVITSTHSVPDRGALQLTDAATCLVEGNTIRVNAGNAIWFHEAAANSDVSYTFTGNNITAPYLINDDTTFGIENHIVSSGNILNIEYPGYCMEKEATQATESTVTLN